MENQYPKNLFTQILERLPDSVIITDNAGIICNWLGASELIFGYPESTVTGKSLTDVLGNPQQELIVTDEFSEGIICKNASGIEIIIRLVYKEKFYDKLLLICRDITAFKKIESIMDTFHDDVHAELEKLVEEKTADLKLLNEQLEDRVSQRTHELEIMQKKLVERAHRAGMAEVAIRNLHNIGNILNNITTSIYIIDRNLKEFPVTRMNKANILLEQKLGTIQAHLEENQVWNTLLSYYLKIEESFKYKHKVLQDTILRLERKVEEINYIISDQHEYANCPALFDSVDVKDLIEEVLANEAELFARHQIKVERDYSIIPDIKIQKQKLNYVILCILKNAIEAMQDNPPEQRTLAIGIKKVLTITSEKEEISIIIQFKDTGYGIDRDHLKKIFNQGFSTHKNKSGISLHTCANYINEMNGKIIASSKGPGTGAAFTILLKQE